MKISAVLMALLTGIGFAYGAGLLNLVSPETGLEKGDFEFIMHHRFFGAALKNEPFETFFGLDNGANAMVGFSYSPLNGITTGLFHSRLWKTNGLLCRWNGNPSGIQLGIEAGLSSIKPTVNADRETGLIASASVAVPLLNGRIRPILNYAFDGNREENGAGLGLEAALTERTALFGEYFPQGDNDTKDCFGAGIRHATWGHQFQLGLTNSSGIGVYEQLTGSSTGDLSFALSVRRKF